LLKLNKVYNEDCIGDKGMCLIQDKTIDLILCDLPYGSTKCKWDTIIPFEPLWEQYKRIIKEDGAIVLFGSEPFSSYLRLSNIDWYKYDWTWDKVKPNGHLVAKYRLMQQTESISVFGAGRVNYFPIMTPREKPKKSKEYARTEIMGGTKTDNQGKILKDKYPKTLITFSNASQKNKLHPTQKLVELCEYLIKTYSKEGDLVLDNCMGSFTTAIASKNLNRNYIGFEMDKTYFELGEQRINNIT